MLAPRDATGRRGRGGPIGERERQRQAHRLADAAAGALGRAGARRRRNRGGARGLRLRSAGGAAGLRPAADRRGRPDRRLGQRPRRRAFSSTSRPPPSSCWRSRPTTGCSTPSSTPKAGSSPATKASRAPAARFATGEFAGEPVRLIRVSRQFSERDFTGDGRRRRRPDHPRPRRARPRDHPQRARSSSGLLGLAMAGLAAFAIRSALAPLRRIEARARRARAARPDAARRRGPARDRRARRRRSTASWRGRRGSSRSCAT